LESLIKARYVGLEIIMKKLKQFSDGEIVKGWFEHVTDTQ
jgi:hypothetical protein